MIAIRGLALAAVAGASAIAFAPPVAAGRDSASFMIEARYDATRTALDNYLAFARQIERAVRLRRGPPCAAWVDREDGRCN